MVKLTKSEKHKATPTKETAMAFPASVLQPSQKMKDILAATAIVIASGGMSRLSIRKVCAVAKVAPGTFYRHFSSQEDLLDVFTRYKRETFHDSLHAAIANVTDPDARVLALLEHINQFLDQTVTTQLLRMEPDYVLDYVQNIFHDSTIRFQELLRESFNLWESRLGIKLDRPLLCDLLMRYIISERMVPSTQDRKKMVKRIVRMIGPLLPMLAARPGS